MDHKSVNMTCLSKDLNGKISKHLFKIFMAINRTMMAILDRIKTMIK